MLLWYSTCAVAMVKIFVASRRPALSDAFVAGVTSAVTGGSADAPHPAGLVRHEGVRVAGKEEPLVLHALG